MSLGGGENATACDGDTRKTAIDSLLAAGIATVISAGNNSFDAAVGTPGCISTAVTVGSTTDADAVSDFSNRGTLVDVMDPGSNVSAACPTTPTAPRAARQWRPRTWPRRSPSSATPT